MDQPQVVLPYIMQTANRRRICREISKLLIDRAFYINASGSVFRGNRIMSK